MKKQIDNLSRRFFRPLTRFFHNGELKRKLHGLLFESDTPRGRQFEHILLASITGMVFVVILESIHSLPYAVSLVLKVLEYLFLFAFSVEYLTRIYCSPRPERYIFSFFGIIDMLATVPFYIGLFFPCIRHFLIIPEYQARYSALIFGAQKKF